LISGSELTSLKIGFATTKIAADCKEKFKGFPVRLSRWSHKYPVLTMRYVKVHQTIPTHKGKNGVFTGPTGQARFFGQTDRRRALAEQTV
jgi:hypothetical protein